MNTPDHQLRSEQTALYADSLAAVEAELSDLLIEAEARGAMLIDGGGHPIAARGVFVSLDQDVLVALTAASFAAMGQVVGMLGGGSLTSVRLTGEGRGLDAYAIGERAFLLVSWAGDAPLAHPQKLLEQHRERLTKSLEVMEARVVTRNVSVDKSERAKIDAES